MAKGQAMTRVNELKRVCCPGGRRWVAVVVAVLAAYGVGGAVPSAALAGSSSVPDWTKLAPRIHPSAGFEAPITYDAATGTVVLFGGTASGNLFNGTWTWNGTTWAKLHPAASPPARVFAAMAYDAATGTVVLFGGANGDSSGDALGGTWTWNGTTWAKLQPATRPPALEGASMAYDAATGTVVLFGGDGPAGANGSTWTWDGITWTRQAPAASPPARFFASMAYDAATGTVVLFGGLDGSLATLGDTWTWDGSTWTRQAPAASPPARSDASMAYDAATGTVVLFGGSTSSGCSCTVLGDTWTWNGTTWIQQAPAASPSAREGASMAYDAATGTAVLFGGQTGGNPHKGTWAWG
jgi:hypothetical protein